MYKHIEVSNQNADSFPWKRYQHLIKQLLDLNSSMSLHYYPSVDEFQMSTLDKIKYFEGKFKLFILFYKEECIGVLEVMLSPKLAYLSILPDYTDVELTKNLVDIYQLCNIDGLRITTSQSEVKDMLEQGGSNLVIHDVIQELKKENIHIENIKSYIDTGLQYLKKEGFTLKFYSKIEGAILDDYVSFHNEVIRDILVYDMENGEQAITISMVKDKQAQMDRMKGGLLYLILFDNGQNIIGLTEVWTPNIENCRHIYSGLTAVKAPYRRNKIAQFLKASIIDKILHEYEAFSILETANSIVNLPVLNLNKKFGFQKVTDEFMIDFVVE